MQPQRDPDASVVAIFKNMAVINVGKSEQAGRPIYDDMEICELRYPGSKNVGAYPATSFSHWGQDEFGQPVKVSYAERFSRQYQQFKTNAVQTKSGTPLQHALFLTEARKAELKALNIYTIEALAEIDGNELKALGQGGREMKNKAIEFLEDLKRGQPNAELVAELEALRAKQAVMMEDLEALRAASRQKKAKAIDDELDETVTGSDNFEEMSIDQLRQYIETHTGMAPKGGVNRRTLIRMADNCRPISSEA